MNIGVLTAGLGAGIVVVSALWVADHSAQVTKLAMEQNATLRKSVEVSEANNATLKKAVLDQQALRVVLGLIDTRTRSIYSTLDGQAAQLNRSLAELKRTDEKTNAYLADLIPGALGMRYARPDTTDPVAYRAGAVVVRPGAVPATGSAAAGDQ
jgi:hypothetical protein